MYEVQPAREYLQKMALIHCHDCGKEISSLATACPSCGAPPRDALVPPPIPTQTSRAKQLSQGTIALLTGVVLALVIRGMTYQGNSPSVARPPTPATVEATTTSPPPVETASQTPFSFTTAETSAGEANTKSSPPVEAVSHSSPSLAAAEATIAGSPADEATSQNSPSRNAREPPYASDVSTTTATPPEATYHVVGIPPRNYLNVRGGAGPGYQVVTKLEPGERGILLSGKRVAKGVTT